MLLAIDFNSDVPIYIQLKQQIIEGIARGLLAEGESLPSVRQLAQDIGINLHTVNKAYNLLREDGFIIMDRRIGAVISTRQALKEGVCRERLKEELAPIVAEVFCKGMKEEDLLREISQIYQSYAEDEKHGL